MIIRRLATVDDFEACVGLQRQVWGFEDLDLVPRRMFVVAASTGGHVLGAYDGARLAGYVLGLPGLHGTRPYFHSHMLAVDPRVRDAGIGRELKLRQRELVLEQGFDLIEWTFDPLEIKNGYFNVMRLGVVARRYLPNHYGVTSSALQAGLPTDRLLAEWWLRSPAVLDRLKGLPAAGVVAAEVEVPAAIVGWKSAGDGRAGAAQARIRAELEAGFESGLAVTGYARRDNGDGVFLLNRLHEGMAL